MEHLFKVYTESGTANVKELKQEVKEINDGNWGGGYEQLARYAIQEPDGKNILIELDVPTYIELNASRSIFMTAYEYEGLLEDYNCDDGDINMIEFNLDWENLESEMAKYARSIIEYDI